MTNTVANTATAALCPETGDCRRVRRIGRRHGAVVVLAAVLAWCPGCGSPSPMHPAVGRTVDNLPLLSLADPSRRPPTFAGRVTLLNFWGTWCPPCRAELPGLARLAVRLKDEPTFQLVAVSCGGRPPEDLPSLAESTRAFLAAERLAIDAWADPTGQVRQIFAASFGFSAFPTTYLIGPDATVRRVWVGYRGSDEADIARTLVGLLREAADAAPGAAR